MADTSTGMPHRASGYRTAMNGDPPPGMLRVEETDVRRAWNAEAAFSPLTRAFSRGRLHLWPNTAAG